MISGYGAAAYLAQLQALLPHGDAWPREPDAAMTRVLGAIAAELARIDARSLDALREADPRTTVETLPEWEADCGLPDCCAGPAIGLEARRAAVVAKLTARGGQSRAYYIEVAAALGVPITIDEFNPWTCEDRCEEPLYDEGWRFAWRVNAPAITITEFVAESDDMTPLRQWGNAPLECAIRSRAPAHTSVLFGYGP